MPDNDPVHGDGVVALPFPGDDEMADVPDKVAEMMMTESAGNIQAVNQRGRDVATTATGVLQAAMAQRYNEVGPVESRAVSGVMATPVASPATGGGS